MCRHDTGESAKSANIWLSGRPVADMSATLPAKVSRSTAGCRIDASASHPLDLPPATPHLSCRRLLSSSSRLCLATRRLRLLTRRCLITGCVVARRRCADVVAVDAQASSSSSRLRLLPLVIVALGIPIWIWVSPYGKVDHRFHTGIWHKWIPFTIRGSRSGNGD